MAILQKAKMAMSSMHSEPAPPPPYTPSDYSQQYPPRDDYKYQNNYSQPQHSQPQYHQPERDSYYQNYPQGQQSYEYQQHQQPQQQQQQQYDNRPPFGTYNSYQPQYEQPYQGNRQVPPQAPYSSYSSYQPQYDQNYQNRPQGPSPYPSSGPSPYAASGPLQSQISQGPYGQIGQRPCVIPQITKIFAGANASPFVRARCPELEQHTFLSASELLAFIDGLNEAFMANPALTATNSIGNVLGFAPSGTLQLVGVGLNVAAGLGGAAVSMTRSKKYMKEANETIFKPKGLHAQICKTKKMLPQVGIKDIGQFQQQQYQTMLNEAQQQQQQQQQRPTSYGGQSPYGQQQYGQQPPAPAADAQYDGIKKRMAMLGDRVMPLSFENVTAPVSPDNWMKKWGAKSAARTEQKQLRKLQGKDGNPEDEVIRITEEMNQLNYQIQDLNARQPRDYKKQRKDMEKDLEDLEKDLKDAQKKAAKAQSKRDKNGGQPSRREQRKVDSIYWILIVPLEDAVGGDEDWASEENDARSVQSGNSGEMRKY